MNITDVNDNAFKLVLALVVGIFASLKVLDAITTRINRGKNGEALRQAGAVCLIVLMMGTTVAGLWIGYKAILSEPPAAPAPPTPTTPPSTKKSLNDCARDKKRGRSGKRRPTQSPTQPSNRVVPSPPLARIEPEQSSPVATPTPTPPPASKTGACTNTPPLVLL